MKNIIAVPLLVIALPALASQKAHRDPAAIKTLEEFGECVALQRTEAIRLLSTLPDSDEENRQASRISTSRCLSSGMLKFKANLLRGAVAEVLLRHEEQNPHDSRKRYTFPTPSAETLMAMPEDQKTLTALILFGQCVAHEDPEAVKALLKSPVESKSESIAFSSLKESMTKCSTGTFRVDRFQMRGYLAEGAYRNAVMLPSS